MSVSAMQLINDERNRQIAVEGYSFEHDDEHTSSEMAMAAAFYAAPAPIFTQDFCGDGDIHDAWPEEWGDAEDARDRADGWSDIRRLTVAGALIVAEIERLQRLEGDNVPTRSLRAVQPSPNP
jgi:hypothetical protein